MAVPNALLLRATMLLAFPIAPAIFALFAVLTLIGSRRSGIQTEPRLVLVPSPTLRGLSASALWIAVILAGSYVIFTSGDTTFGTGNLAPWLVASDLLTIALMVTLALIALRLFRDRSLQGASAGVELVLAYAVTFFGVAGPALLVAGLSRALSAGF